MAGHDLAWLSERDLDDPGRLRFGDDNRASDPVTCDECGQQVIYLVSLACLGQFCSRHCANLASEKHALVMEKRRA